MQHPLQPSSLLKRLFCRRPEAPAMRRLARRLRRTLIELCVLTLSLPCLTHAETDPDRSDTGRVSLVFSPYVWHTHNGDHNESPWLTGLELEPTGFPLNLGAVFFRNSFNQNSVYAYVGKRWFLAPDEQGPFVNLTAGPLYGYRHEYEDKVPLNHGGLGLAIIPGVGYQYRAFNAQLVVLGTAALMVTFGYDFRR